MIELGAEQHIVTALLLLVAVVSIIMGVFVLKTERKRLSIIFYSHISFSVSAWVIARAFLQLSDPFGAADTWAYLIFIPPVFIALFLVLFSLYIGQEQRRMSFLEKIVLFGPWLVLLATALIPDLIVERVHKVGNVNEIIYVKYFKLVYAPLISVYLISIFPILLSKYRKVNYLIRLQLRYVILASFISIGVAVVSNIILPTFGVTNIVWMGPLAAIVLVTLVGYALTRKKLWDFKLIFTELLVALILIIQFAEIFFASNDLPRAIFQSFAFIIMATFSVFLVREIYREIEARDSVSELPRELSIVNGRLQEIDAEKSDFVSIATHQLRTPLTVVKGYSSMLLEGSFGPLEDENKREVIQKIYNASQRLVVMIEDFLDISRIEEGKMSYFFEKVNVSDFIEEVVDEQRKTIKEEVYKFTSTIEPNLHIIADKLKLRQVVTNLIDNAMKYSPKGTGISIDLKNEGSKIIVRIKDSGSGIAKDAMPTLFRKFSRGDAFSKLQTEGRGLGLYIAKQIMNAHGGKIWLESEGRDKGTTAVLEMRQFIQDESRKEIKEFVKEVG